MERSAGFLTADKRGRRHAEKRWKEMGGRTKPGAGSATAIGKMECGQEDMWSRRSQVAVSAGFWSGNRDYGEEDENEHRHRGSLGSPAGAARAGDT